MDRLVMIMSVLLLNVILCMSSAQAGAQALSVNEFRQLYDTLLAGKTLVTETKQDGLVIRKERQFGNAIDVGGGEFEIPSKMVVVKSRDGAVVQKITASIADEVDNLGGNALITEHVRNTTVETTGEQPRTTRQVEFGGTFLVAKNDKGGFDVYSFGLTPSVLVEGDSTSMAGNMVSYSCYPESGISKCILTIRDYKLGEYDPLRGFNLLEPAGGDYTEAAVEIKQ